MHREAHMQRKSTTPKATPTALDEDRAGIDALLDQAKASPELRRDVRNFAEFRMQTYADAALVELGQQADAAYADYFGLGTEATQADQDKAHDRRKEIATKIIATPARTLAGLRVKARVIGIIHLEETEVAKMMTPKTRPRTCGWCNRSSRTCSAGS